MLQETSKMATPHTLSLKEVFNHEGIQNLRPFWKDLGSQLGVSDGDINAIAADYPNDCKQCTRRVLQMRQKVLPLDWSEVNNAIANVKSRVEADKKLQQHKLSIEREQKEVMAAIDKLKISMDGLDGRNKEIAENMADLKKELEVEMASLSPLKIQWQKEDEEWQGGAGGREQIRAAINEKNFKESQFVKNFFRKYSRSLENLTDEEIEGSLRQHLLTEEEIRSKQLRVQYHKVRLHHKNLKHLLEKIHKLKLLVEDRLHEAYAVILKSLEDVGLKDERIKDLKDKLETLNETLQDCEQGLKECDKEIANGRRSLIEFKNELKSFLKPFHEVVDGMNTVITRLEHEEQDLQRDFENIRSKYKKQEEKIKTGMVVGGVAGLATGAALGTAFLPFVGTAIGGAFGYLWAKQDTSTLDRLKKQLKQAEMKLATKRGILRPFKTTEDIGKMEVKELKKLIEESV